MGWAPVPTGGTGVACIGQKPSGQCRIVQAWGLSFPAVRRKEPAGRAI